MTTLSEPPILDVAPRRGLCAVAARIRERSVAQWGAERAIDIVGQSPEMVGLLERLAKIASFDEPVLVLGESGVGKEALAQSIYLLGRRAGGPFLSLNCPQYQDGNLTVSELFGHRRGSFTGAVTDRKGCFETADGGVIFLDEIGDLPMSAQLMLLRALASGEFQPLGAEKPRRSNVRVVAATNRSLNQMAGDRQFRRDLLFRLRYFLFQVPPLRERGDDWLLLVEHVLHRLHARYGVEKRFSDASLRLLDNYTWPGNVRELIGVTTTGYALSDGGLIEPRNFVESLEDCPSSFPGTDPVDELLVRLARRDETFWELVQRPYLDRDLNRREVQRLISRGLRRAGGSYRRLLPLWGLPDADYQKFMDFLRHNRLKPAEVHA